MQRREFVGEVGRLTLGAAALAAVSRSSIARAAAPKIKIGQIGTTHAHASGKLETIRQFSEHFELVGVVEPDADRRAALEAGEPYRGVKWLTEEQLLNTPGLAAVAVETEIKDLIPTASRCVAAGMHVHVDKPAGESLSEFSRLLDDASQRRLTVQMGYMFRHNPAFQFCFKAVREGWLGDVFEAHGVISKKVDAAGRKRFAEYRGGVMFELGCHLIDALVATLGKPDAVSPHARQTRPDVDNLADNQLAVFEYPKATATIRSSFLEPHGGDRRQFIVCGDRGTVEIRPLEPPRLLLALESPQGAFKNGYQEVELPAPVGRYDGDFLDLAAIIRGEKPSDYPPAHDLAVQEAVLLASGLPLS